MYKQKIFQLLRFCTVMLSGLIAYLFIYYAVSYILPFLLAIIFAFLLNPVVTLLEKTLKMPRGFAVFIVLAMTVITIIGLIILVISELIHGTTYLAEAIPNHFGQFVLIAEEFINERALPLYHNLASYFHTLSPDQQENINESIHQLTHQLASSVTTILNTLLQKIPQTLALLPGSFTVMLFTVMAAFFVTKDWHLLVLNIKKMIPQNLLHMSNNVWNHLQKAFSGFIKAQLILVLITTLTILTGLLILRVDYALTIALFAGLADILPFIGTGIIFIPWIIYLFLTGNYAFTIALAALYMVVIIQRQLLEPKILSDSAGLNPLATLMALFIGIQIWGAAGLLIGPLLVLTGNAFYQAGIFHRLGSFIKGA